MIGEHQFQLLLFTMTDNSITCIVTSITDSDDVHFSRKVHKNDGMCNCTRDQVDFVMVFKPNRKSSHCSNVNQFDTQRFFLFSSFQDNFIAKY